MLYNCSKIYGIINPKDENEFISWKNDNKIYFDPGGYHNCSEIYGIINPKNENECIIFKDENKCINSCPDGYELIIEIVSDHRFYTAKSAKKIIHIFIIKHAMIIVIYIIIPIITL